jgi:type IV secretory pathway VirB2 component (pilin)
MGGTGGGWLTIVQTIATFIESGFGATLVVVAVAIAGARAALHGHWGHFWSAIGGGAIVITAAWIVTTFLGGTVTVGGG